MANRENILVPLAIVIAGIFIAVAIFLSNRPADTGSEEIAIPPAESIPSTVKVAVAPDDHIRGNPEAPVTIVEFSDFQCPFCASFHPTLKQILAEYPGQVRWVYKHFPLDQPPQILHPHARPAAEASECSAEQGKFWEFNDRLFENQNRLGAELYNEIAVQLNLNMTQFEECVNSRKYQAKVQAHYEEGVKLGVRGTPGSFINGEVVEGALPLEIIKSIIESKLNP